jgi:integrase
MAPQTAHSPPPASVVNFPRNVNEDRQQADRVSLWLIVSVEITNYRMGEVVMISQGVIFKRCGCQDPASGGRLGRTCPQLTQGKHGSWYFHVSVTNLIGRRERVRRGGYPSRAAARHARDEALGRSQQDQSGHAWTVERWLRYWLSTRVGIRPTTRLSHTQYIERFLIPHLGKIRLAELTARQLTAFFAAVGQKTNRFGQPHTPTTLAHIRTTLRAALNSAIREGLIRDNPARQVELPSRRRAHALVWTPGRVADWRATGIRPTIAVWTAAQLAAFLDSVRPDRLYALWWLAALRGLRRGEVAGLRWADLDLDHRQLVIVRARTTAGYQVFEGPPKSAASTRTIALDRHTIAALRPRPPAAPGTRRRWRPMARHRIRVHQPPRRPTAPRVPHPPLGCPGDRGRTAPDPPARPTPRRRHAGTSSRY